MGMRSNSTGRQWSVARGGEVSRVVVDPWRMLEGYCNHCVRVCVCVYYYASIVWILLTIKVLATFTDHRCFLRFLLSSRSMKVPAMASFQD